MAFLCTLLRIINVKLQNDPENRYRLHNQTECEYIVSDLCLNERKYSISLDFSQETSIFKNRVLLTEYQFIF